MNKNHELKTDCAGCAEIIGFLEIPGYSGDKRNPVDAWTSIDRIEKFENALRTFVAKRI